MDEQAALQQQQTQTQQQLRPPAALQQQQQQQQGPGRPGPPPLVVAAPAAVAPQPPPPPPVVDDYDRDGEGSGGEDLRPVLAGDPVPGMRQLLRLMASSSSSGGGLLSPLAVQALGDAMAAAVGAGKGTIDDSAFATALRAGVPALRGGSAGAGEAAADALLEAMHLVGLRAIDYRDFAAALDALAANEGYYGA